MTFHHRLVQLDDKGKTACVEQLVFGGGASEMSCFCEENAREITITHTENLSLFSNGKSFLIIIHYISCNTNTYGLFLPQIINDVFDDSCHSIAI